MSKKRITVKVDILLSGSDIAVLEFLEKEPMGRFAHLKADGNELASQGLIKKSSSGSSYRGKLTSLGEAALLKLREEAL